MNEFFHYGEKNVGELAGMDAFKSLSDLWVSVLIVICELHMYLHTSALCCSALYKGMSKLL